MLKHTIVALLCLSLTATLTAQDNDARQDTIILQRSDTSFTFQHKITTGQTLYSLSKTYQTTLPAIHRCNPNLMETELGIGDTISIPLNLELLQSKPVQNAKNNAVAIYHVQHGETLFAIAKRWLHTEMSHIKNINKLESAVLPLHTPLTIGWIDTRFIKSPKPSAEDVKIAEMDQALITEIQESIQGLEPVIEGGKAIWKTSKSSGDQPFVLHRKAKINSLVQLYNPMTGKKIHAKVVGRIPERNYDDNVMVVLTPYLANALKARDKAFFLKMKYIM